MGNGQGVVYVSSVTGTNINQHDPFEWEIRTYEAGPTLYDLVRFLFRIEIVNRLTAVQFIAEFYDDSEAKYAQRMQAEWAMHSRQAMKAQQQEKRKQERQGWGNRYNPSMKGKSYRK